MELRGAFRHGAAAFALLAAVPAAADVLAHDQVQPIAANASAVDRKSVV